MENGKDQKINCDMKTDLNLLLECLKYQMDHPASQKEALVTIYSVCQQNSAACEYFREIGGLMFVWNLAKSQVHSLVQEAALFTIGGLAENNVFCQQMLCTAELFKDLRTFLTNKDSSMNLKRMSVYVLLVLASNNNSGQTHVRESGCLDILLHLFRVIPSESQMNLFDCKIDQYHLWSSVCTRTQNFFISIGGLAVLDELLLKLIHSSLGNNTNIKLAVVVTKTLDACIANNTAVGVHLPKYNIVPNLLKLLSYNILDSGERFSIILTLGHCTEVCEENQYTLVKNNGLPLMIQALTEMQDDELNKAATFVLQNCKQMSKIIILIFENIRREILIDEGTPQEEFLQAMTQHHRTNSSKQPSDNSKIYLEMKHPLQNTISKVQNTSKFEKSSSSREQVKPAIWNSTDDSLAQNHHNNLLYATEKITTPSINEAYITNKNSCRIGNLSLNSRNFSKTLQSCQYLCERHKIILESEMEYKRKLRRSIIANKNTSAYNNDNHDEQRVSYKRSSTTNTETLSNRSTTTLKKRRIRKDFTSEEISYLLEGVRKMGHHWNSILWAYPFQKGRTNVDLAKKYCKLQLFST
ncbi:Coiled-coil domain-containing protein 79, partial [Ophiophagus hannah]